MPASRAPNMSLTPRSSETATMPKQVSRARRTGRFSTTLRAGVRHSPLSRRGMTTMATTKKISVTIGVLTTS